MIVKTKDECLFEKLETQDYERDITKHCFTDEISKRGVTSFRGNVFVNSVPLHHFRILNAPSKDVFMLCLPLRFPSLRCFYESISVLLGAEKTRWYNFYKNASTMFTIQPSNK